MTQPTDLTAIEAGETAEETAGHALLAIIETLDNDLETDLPKETRRRLTNTRNTLKSLMNGNSAMRPIIHAYAREKHGSGWLKYLQLGVSPDRQPVTSDGRNIFKPQKK